MHLTPDQKLAGILAPLFALRSVDDLGVGDVGALRELIREDLDGYAVEDLEARAEALRAEILRTEAAVTTKRQKKSPADALFSFGNRDT